MDIEGQILRPINALASFLSGSGASIDFHLQSLPEAEKLRVKTVKQVHGTKIVDVTHEEANSIEQEADGLVNRNPRQAIAIKTADCLPIIMINQKFHLALHAGWRGLFANIIGSGIQQLINHSIDPSEVRLVIGPAICTKDYEVGREFHGLFEQAGLIKNAHERDSCFTTFQDLSRRGDGKLHFNLKAAALLQLRQCGVRKEQIFIADECTFCSKHKWPSYRRDGVGAGRLFTVVRFVA